MRTDFLRYMIRAFPFSAFQQARWQIAFRRCIEIKPNHTTSTTGGDILPM